MPCICASQPSRTAGSGFYADDVSGAAAATGEGDRILQHCMSLLAVQHMEAGLAPADACSTARPVVVAVR